MKMFLTIILMCIAFASYSQPKGDARALFRPRNLNPNTLKKITDQKDSVKRIDTTIQLQPLTGRTFIVRPHISDDGVYAGVVTVKVVVACDGTILKARSGERGTTIPNAGLWEICEKALLKSKLNAIEESKIDSGVVKFTFVLN